MRQGKLSLLLPRWEVWLTCGDKKGGFASSFVNLGMLCS
ncbi:hypothetical protein JCM19238_4932 [Vibrio ponticus]|nr:hypothetical protein JCM19238_4932 [Vibrio ponticus]